MTANMCISVVWVEKNPNLPTHFFQICYSKHIFFLPIKLGKQKIYIMYLQVSALKKLGMVGQHNILFCQNILNRNCVFQYIFPIFQQT